MDELVLVTMVDVAVELVELVETVLVVVVLLASDSSVEFSS